MEFTEVEVERVAIALEDLGGKMDGFCFALALQQLCEERLLISLLLVLQGLLHLEPSLLVLPTPADLHRDALVRKVVLLFAKTKSYPEGCEAVLQILTSERPHLLEAVHVNDLFVIEQPCLH